MISISSAGQWIRGTLYTGSGVSAYLMSNETFREIYGKEGVMWVGVACVVFITIRAYLDLSPGSQLPEIKAPGLPFKTSVEEKTTTTVTVDTDVDTTETKTERTEKTEGGKHDEDCAG